MNYMAVFGVVFLLLAVSSLFVFSGYLLWQRVFKTNSSVSFLLGASFFSGVVLYISLFGIIESIFSSAHTAVGVSLALMLLGTLLFLPIKNFFDHVSIKHVLLGFFIFTSWLIINTVHALQPLPGIVKNPEHTHPSLGFIAAEHSFRLENIIVTMSKNDSLPYINQNSAQAILAFIPNVFGLDVPQFSIVVWHTIVVLFVALLVYGCARFFLSRAASLVPTAFVMLGNTAISYQYISVTDSGHALLLIRNYEVVIGLASFLLLALVLRGYLFTRLSIYSGVYLFIVGFSWSVVGGHYLLIMLAVLALMYLYNFSKVKLANLFGAIFILITSTAIGTLLLGGLFAFNAPQSNIPGVKSVKEGGNDSALEFRAFRTVEAEYHTRLKLVYLLESITDKNKETESGVSLGEPIKVDSESRHVDASAYSLSGFNGRLHTLIDSLKTNETLWDVIRFVRSVQLVAIPLLGMLIFYWLYTKRGHDLLPTIKESCIYILPMFLAGWIISSVFLVYGQYGETSRFFAPGVSGLMFLLGLLMVRLYNQTITKFKVLAVSITALVLVPVVVDYVLVGLVGNFYLPPTQALIYEARGEGSYVSIDDVLTPKERIDILLSSGKIRGESL